MWLVVNRFICVVFSIVVYYMFDVVIFAVVVALCGLGAVGLFFSLLLSVFRAKYQGYPYRYVQCWALLSCYSSVRSI